MLKNNSNKVESLQVFNYGENTPVRVRVMNGQTWFVAKDVCKVLGIEKARNAVSRLEDDERGPVLVDTLGGTQRMSAVSESGLYHLVFQSRKPEAKKFRRWVTGEVLPQIRMTGGYRAAGSPRCERAQAPASSQAGSGMVDALSGDAINRVSTRAAGSPGRMPVPRERSAELGAFYAELRKWVLKEDEAAVAELAGVGVAHVREVLAGRKPGYGVLRLLVEYATENRAAGRQRVVRSAARRAEQVEELRLDFMAASRGSEWHVGTKADMRQTNPLRMGSTAREPQNRRVSPGDNGPTGTGCDRGAMVQAAGSACSELRRDESRLYEGGGSLPAQDVTDGIIDFNGMEG